VTTSIGIAFVFSDDSDVKTLMQNADIAMYRAKSQGYNRYQVYDALMSRDYKKAIEIEALLRQTNAEKDFELYYQPQYALPGRELVGAEALIRWNNPEHGFIPPNVFIPIAEQIDYIFKIGEWVMQETVRQAEKWNRQYEMPLKVGFNISPKQFQDAAFISLLKTLILDKEVDPEWIDAEITESVMMNSGDGIINIFSVFHELGITVSIDDFGSGYSALGNLIKYPFDRIKLDKSLIDNISVRDISGINVVKAAISMAHASGIMTIAEGVETQEQLDILAELDCDQVQGYHLGRPVPAEVFEDRYIKRHYKKAEIS
jgi:EAL domain-containing protein (putative c-di-GMP-specific phosphodiesterase class I)